MPVEVTVYVQGRGINERFIFNLMIYKIQINFCNQIFIHVCLVVFSANPKSNTWIATSLGDMHNKTPPEHTYVSGPISSGTLMPYYPLSQPKPRKQCGMGEIGVQRSSWFRGWWAGWFRGWWAAS